RFRRVRRCARNRQELFGSHPLLKNRLEFIVDDKYLVNLFVLGEPFDHVPRNLERLRKVDASLAGDAYVFPNQTCTTPTKEVSALTAHRQNIDVLARVLANESLGSFDQIGVEGPAQTLVGSYQDQQIPLIASRIE